MSKRKAKQTSIKKEYTDMVGKQFRNALFPSGLFNTPEAHWRAVIDVNKNVPASAQSVTLEVRFGPRTYSYYIHK